jgi:hypothetical protein
MSHIKMLGAIAFAAACLGASAAAAFDETKYPDWKGKWDRITSTRWIQPGEKPPLTPEYQAIFAKNTAEQKAGGHGWETSWMCLPPGMPRIMNAYEPMEIVVTPATTYILISHVHDNRRIYTDGREWPKDLEPSWKGYSIGEWLDTDGDGRFDTLVVETRGMKGQRSYGTDGLPLHANNKTIVNERIYQDKADPNVLLDEITTIDDALTRPWTITKKYKRDPNPPPSWIEEVCSENNPHIRIGHDNYMLSADGYLMPSRKGQEPPSLKYFKQSAR